MTRALHALAAPLLSTMIALSGCDRSVPGDTSTEDILGPFAGETRRYAVDKLTLPTSNRDTPLLDPAGRRYNMISNAVGVLASQGDVAPDAPRDQLASGALRPWVEITSPGATLAVGDRVGVAWHMDTGPAYGTLGGIAGSTAFRSNRLFTTTHPVPVDLVLPLFADAAPLWLQLLAAEIDLAPDGRGGFDGQLHGVARPDVVLRERVREGLNHMLAAFPADHRSAYLLFDTDRSGEVSRAEFDASDLLTNVLAPDLDAFDAQGGFHLTRGSGTSADVLSVGIGFHLVPCPSGSCPPAGPPAACDNRVLDGNEADIDCGPGCHRCPAGATCRTADDCQAGACNLGVCGTPSCENGRLDVDYETDIDCGGGCLADCAVGRRCRSSGDCGSGNWCDQGLCARQ